MDVLKTLADKAFWGHEFLTWLWFTAEEAAGELEVPGFGPVTLWIEDRMVLGSLETDSKENILKDGDVSRSAEAAAALSVGKKLEEARFGLIREDREWLFTLKGQSFDLQGVKIPKVMTEKDDDLHSTILVRVGHVRELTDVVDALYGKFSALRVAPEWDSAMVPAISRWIAAKTGG